MTDETRFLHFRKWGWFWTFSVDYSFRLGRTLVKSGGCNNYLQVAPEELPVIQTTPLPEIP